MFLSVEPSRPVMGRDYESPYSLSAISRRLSELRAGLELSQAEMGAHAGVSGNAWGNYEAGDRRIDLDAAIRLEDSLSVPQEWVYRGVTNRLTDDIKVAIINGRKALLKANKG